MFVVKCLIIGRHTMKLMEPLSHDCADALRRRFIHLKQMFKKDFEVRGVGRGIKPVKNGQ